MLRWDDWKYLLAYIGPATAFAAIYLGGVWSYSAVVLAFLIIPLSELLVPADGGNVPAASVAHRQGRRYFDWLLYANIPILYSLIVFFLWRVMYSELAAWEIVGMTLGVGTFVGASGINVAHELGHRAAKAEQIMSLILLLPALYMHFQIEHNRGHHRYVATPQDPATARYGEWIYAFWLRSAIQGYMNAWRLEATRLRKEGLPLISRHNLMLVYGLLQLGYLAIIYVVFGWLALALAVVIAAIGVLLLESINYIEHYGLLRQQRSEGHYERVQHHHSWNSNHDLGRIFLYELTRHPDHHYKASKKYQVLEHISESPQLPLGYPGSILLTLVPPLWFRLMNPRVPAGMRPQQA